MLLPDYAKAVIVYASADTERLELVPVVAPVDHEPQEWQDGVEFLDIFRSNAFDE